MNKHTAIFNNRIILALTISTVLLLSGPVRAGFDEDGNRDFIIANNGEENEVCLVNKSNISCSNISSVTDGSLGLALDDLDKDGHLDVVFANRNENRVCLGDGTGSFICDVMNNDTSYSTNVELGYLDGDGNLDAVFANYDSNPVCFGDGLGGFSCSGISIDSNNSTGVALGDLDSDNDLDVVFANHNENRVCLGNGTGGFTCSNVSSDSNYSNCVKLGYLNDDDYLDVLFGNYHQNRVCFGDGAGAFSSCINASSADNYTVGMALGYLNNDSHLDVMFANRNSPNQLCLGNGTGSFSSCSNLSNDTNETWAVDLSDLDRDGFLDAVIAESNDPNILCFGDGTGDFDCQNMDSTKILSNGVAITKETDPPQVVNVWLVMDTSSPVEGITQIAVRFNELMQRGYGPDGAENPDNYSVTLDGEPLTIRSIDYDPSVKTSIITLAEAFEDGAIEVTVFGSTSITDIDGNKLNGGSGTGTDFTLNFTMDLGLGDDGAGSGSGGSSNGGSSGSGGGRGSGTAATSASNLPGTGFPPGVYTPQKIQPEALAYQPTGGLRLEAPTLGIDTEIMGVPFADGEWDVSWLGGKVGWLEGSAYPAMPGNTALTGHVVDNNGYPGPFARLGELGYGDTVVLHSQGHTYTYSVRQSLTVFPDDTSVLRHEDYDWLTLITCQGYDEQSGHYGFRRVVRAVLVDVSAE